MSPDRRLRLLATGALLMMTACWGSTFFLIHDLMDRMDAVDFLAVRFPIGALVLTLCFPRALPRLSAQARRRGAVVGLLYGAAQILQTMGLAHTIASLSGFLTGLYVVLTPVLAALLLRARLGPLTWLAVALAMTGIVVLTLNPGGLAFGYGESLTVVSAVLYALHIVALGVWSRPGDAMGLTVLQMWVISIVCLIGAAPGGIELPDRAGDWWSVIYMAVFAGALALVGQTWAQAHLSATRSAIIMSMEPVFAALFAVLLGGERFGAQLAIGGALVLTAMLVTELRGADRDADFAPSGD